MPRTAQILRLRLMLLALVLLAWLPAVSVAEGPAERIRLATWNIEHFSKMFDQAHMPERSQDRTELFRDEEDLYEVARTLELERFRPDVLGIQEGCDQAMLERFNERWLNGTYATVRAFEGNSPGQHVGLMMKPGFELLEIRDGYYREADPVEDPAVRSAKRDAGLAAGNLLFSRGPVFAKVRTPGGQTLWMGITHAKSKYRNSAAVTRWRIRELDRTRQIALELLGQTDVDSVVVLGDFNDEFGLDEHEQAVGRDAVAVMLEAGEGRLVSPTRELAERDPNLATYHCELKPPRYRSFIDHIFLSQGLADRVVETRVIDAPIAAVASDHYPVLVELAAGE